MNVNELKRILISFADNASEVEINKGKLTAIIRNDVISAEIIFKEDELYISEDGVEKKVISWISSRLAQLDLLADRVREYINPVKEFINPNGRLLDDIDIDPTEQDRYVPDITLCLQEQLNRRIPGTTDVIYLTSDAGEGKTTLINHLAVEQANQFKKKETRWLLIPIPLGGRPFLRFDDIVIASLVNRLRFRSLYYESFIELIKLGLIVPAFDGFEEMFMENSSGEALSATGQLMSKLESSGNILIAARQAYFDYKSFSSQAKLFDTIGSNSVSFSKISINRWSKEQFINYAFSLNINEGEKIYDVIDENLGSEHPLLTRPVLISRLLEVVPSTEKLREISSVLKSTSEYFPNFVNAIIKREAETKWIDTSGEPYKPLLTIEQHYDLLSIIAEEMWFNSTDSLSLSVVDILSDLYSESQSFNVRISRQIKERIKQHALLIKADQVSNQLKFDHEEFQEFFLGVAFSNAIKKNDTLSFKNLMRKGLLFDQTLDTIATYCKIWSLDITSIVKLLNSVQVNEGPTSFVKENCGNLILRIITLKQSRGVTLDNYSFSLNSLVGTDLNNITVRNSYFQTSSLFSTKMSNCLFEFCSFDSLEIDHEHINIRNSILRNSEISSIQNKQRELTFYDPYNIEIELKKVGFIVEDADEEIEAPKYEIATDEDLELVQKVLRRFVRGSYINDNVFRIKLGSKAVYFIDELLPILLENGIIAEVDYVGSGQKRRFKLNIPFDKINTALKESRGSFTSFVEICKNYSNKE